MPGGTGRQLVPFKQDRIFPAELGQVEQDRAANNAAANDNDFGMRRQLLCACGLVDLNSRHVSVFLRTSVVVCVCSSEISGSATLRLALGNKGIKFFPYCRVQRRSLIGSKALFPLGVSALDRNRRPRLLPGLKVAPVTQDRYIEGIAITRLGVFRAKEVTRRPNHH